MTTPSQWADLAYRAVADPIGLDSVDARGAAKQAAAIWTTLGDNDRALARAALTDRIVHGIKTLIETKEGIDHD